MIRSKIHDSVLSITVPVGRIMTNTDHQTVSVVISANKIFSSIYQRPQGNYHSGQIAVDHLMRELRARNLDHDKKVSAQDRGDSRC